MTGLEREIAEAIGRMVLRARGDWRAGRISSREYRRVLRCARETIGGE